MNRPALPSELSNQAAARLSFSSVTTGLGSPQNTRSKSLNCSSASTQMIDIRAVVSGSRYASESWNITVVASGLNLSPPDEGQRFTSRSPDNKQSGESSDTKQPCILLVEDNESDSFLVRQALKEH